MTEWSTTAARATVPAAGWYPDPSGSGANRYWDGSRWTDAVAAAAAVGQRRDPQGGVRGFLHTPVMKAVVVVLALLVLGSIASGMQTANDTQDYYDSLYDS